MRVLEPPSTVRAAFLADEVDRLSHPLVRRHPGAAQILQRSQNIVVIAGWERELGPGGVDHFASRKAVKQMALEQEFLPPFTRGGHRRGAARSPFVLQKPFEDADRGVERAAPRSVLLLAVPPAVAHLLAQQPVHETRALRLFTEVRAERHDPPIDARLHLALEERLVVP